MVHETLSLKKKNHKKRAYVVVLGPDFKLQYWKKDTNNFQ
jgi:hypothetical protein